MKLGSFEKLVQDQIGRCDRAIWEQRGEIPFECSAERFSEIKARFPNAQIILSDSDGISELNAVGESLLRGHDNYPRSVTNHGHSRLVATFSQTAAGLLTHIRGTIKECTREVLPPQKCILGYPLPKIFKA